MNLSFRRCVLIVGLCAGLLQSPVQAAETGNLLANLNAQRLGAYQLQTLFHLLTIEEGASAVAQQLNAAASSFALQVEQMDELSAGLGLDAEVAGVQAEARRLRGLAESNQIISQGYVDLHTQNDLSISASALTAGYAELLDKLARQGQPSDPLQEQAILMQRIAAGYVRESASLDGGSAIYDSARDLEQSVDALAAEFRQQLQVLDQRFAAQPLVSARLKQVTTTWNYIEKPLLHYKEKSVPFVVVRYSDKIVAGLTAGERVEAAR